MTSIDESAALGPVPLYDATQRPGWMAFKCAGCGSLSLAQGVFHRVHGTWLPGLFTVGGWYPKAPLSREYPDSVPTQIASVATEAHGSLSVKHYRAAIALARAVVESAAKAKGITAGTLMQKIDALHAQGFIYEHVKDAAHEVRHGGNEIAHGDLVDDPVDEEEAGAILELMDMVLDGVFIAPGKTAAQKAARLAKKAQGTAGP